MMKNPQVLFEVSWEVCNMVGGIHTVIASKVHKMQEFYGNQYITIGPDILRLNEAANVFREEAWEPSFLESLSDLGIGCRMGKWLIPGEPRCLLINFGDLLKNQNSILAEYWENFQLHSLHGGWDYFEPVCFGHAAGMVIERLFNRHYRSREENVVVHCHEWLTGSTVLYLRKSAPEVGTIFTTHATAMGRSVSSHLKDFDFSSQIPGEKLEQMAHDLGVSAKHSMEAVVAKATDCFTTVSTTTAEECIQLLHRKPDLVLPNALGEDFQNPEFSEPQAVRKTRERLLEIAKLATRTHYDMEQTKIVMSSGRYEFTNKGVDVFLDSLNLLNQKLKASNKNRVVVFLMFPAGHTGPKRVLLAASKNKEQTSITQICTHDLTDEWNDPIHQKLRSFGMLNQPENPVHVVFIPIYLDGTDPLIHETYYRLLAGGDLTVFPSFYEPWGYTPMESIAYGVPTITSDLAGFGCWAQENGASWSDSGVCILKRKGRSSVDAAEDLCMLVSEFLGLPAGEQDALRKAALKTSKQSRWKIWGKAYFKAHSLAVVKALQRTKPQVALDPKLVPSREVQVSQPVDVLSHMRSFNVLNKIPAELMPLSEMARNLWWSWQPELIELFTELDSTLWIKSGLNPVVFLERVNLNVLEEAAQSKNFIKKLNAVYSRFQNSVEPSSKTQIAFFCAEYGLATCLKVYSGGLGILAGDLLKAASDRNLPLCAVGLAYHTGYFRQKLNRDGHQEHHYDRNDFFSLPMSLVSDAQGEPILIQVPFPSGPVFVRAWETKVGKVSLYLLDTDFSANRPFDRAITNSLYGGDLSHRLRQEFILGVGGFRFLKALGHSPHVYHMNEGHSSFLILARMVELVREKNLKYEEALEFIRNTSVFTTHTPVAAGHDQFPEDVIRAYLAPFEEALHKDWSSLMSIGQVQNSSGKREFSMTYLALRGSVRVNGVSEIHGKVSRGMFKGLYPGLHELEVPIGSITNGVHIPTWLSPELQQFFSKALTPSWREHLTDTKYWEKARGLDSKGIWKAHQQSKMKLMDWLKNHIEESYKYRREDPVQMTKAINQLNEETLLIGFARRFAPYKRANLLFQHLEKLEELLSKGRPVVFLFAGKAHPSDGMGQGLIQRIIEVSRLPAFAGKIIFIENYELHIAQLLVSGCDVWLNTPTRPLEASGTSGMKAGINGVLNLSVADGWWAEGFNGKNGWVIGDRNEVTPHDFQNEYDSAQIYTLLEQEIFPLFFSRSDAGVPEDWVAMMKESIATITPKFSSERMLQDYENRYYKKAIDNFKTLSSKEYSKLYEVCELKDRLQKNWGSISFVDVQIEGLEGEKVVIDKPVRIKIDLGHPNLLSEDIEVQAVLARMIPEVGVQSWKVETLEKRQSDNLTRTSSWQGSISSDEPGAHALGVRVIPRQGQGEHELEPFRDLVKWL